MKKRKLKSFLILLPAFLLISLVFLLNQLKLFNLKKITCYLDDHPCSLEFEPYLVNLYGTNILKFDKKKLINQLTHFDESLSDFKIEKKLPNSLTITIKRRTPIAKIISAVDLEFSALNSTASATISGKLTKNFFMLDKTGELFSTTNQSHPSLPLVLISNHHHLIQGQSHISSTLTALIKILKSHYVSFVSLAWLVNNQIIIQTPEGVYVILNSDQPLNSTVASLQYILTNIKIDQKLPTKIDLRFDKPVLTY